MWFIAILASKELNAANSQKALSLSPEDTDENKTWPNHWLLCIQDGVQMALALGDHMHAYVCIHIHILISLLQVYRNKKATDPLCILYYSVIGLLQIQRLETFLFSFSWCGWLSGGLSRTELSSENFQRRSPVFSYLKMVTEEPWHFAGTSGSSVQWPLGSGLEHGLCI